MSDIVKKTVRPFRSLRFLGKNPHTIIAPHSPHRDIEGDPLPTERYRGVHINDWDACIGCGICATVCPCDAIEMHEIEGEAKKRPEISYGRCCFCGFCEEACPKKCLHMTSNYVMLDRDPDAFIFLPTPSISEFEEEYCVEAEQMCYLSKEGDKVKVKGDPRPKKGSET
jgi:formate hydrogenlyase subunit 6/NADH:ubiquinone oxidoreductase subunit I